MKLIDILTYLYRIPRYFFRKNRESIRTFLWKRNLVPSFIKNKEALLKLKDKHKGEPCILFGGGPSLNKMDLNKFSSYVTIGCNGFFYKFDDLSFVPTYYTVEDPRPAEDNKDQINSIKNTIRIIPIDLRKVINNKENTIYVNFRRSAVNYKSPNFPYYSHDFLNESFWGGTVMYFNIQLAEYLGCNPIYLVGVDLSYTVLKSVKKIGGTLISTEDDVNHFDPRYFGAGKRWGVPETGRMQKGFETALRELNSVNIDLYNAGVDSKLKNIPRVTIK